MPTARRRAAQTAVSAVLRAAAARINERFCSLRYAPEAAFIGIMNERVVALDIGDVRIGVAVSDLTRTIATPVEVITRIGWGPDTKAVRALCDRYETTIVVSGLPLNMDGSEGFQAKKVRSLCDQLVKAGLTVFFQDERLSTVMAEDALLEGNVSRENRKGKVDKVAAAVILEQWLRENS